MGDKHYEPFNHLSKEDIERIKRQQKERKCLNCERKFVSHGPNNRLCLNCRNLGRG